MIERAWNYLTSPTMLLAAFAVGCGQIAADLTPGVHGVGIVAYVVALFASVRAYAAWVES